MTDRGPLYAVSPLDGRYARYTEPLTEYAGEAALMRARIEVEVEYLIALADLEPTPLSLDTATRSDLRELYRSFDADDAEIVKQLETEGTAATARRTTTSRPSSTSSGYTCPRTTFRDRGCISG